VTEFSDKVLVCRDCGSEFVFSAGEQDFYATRGFSEPTRCPDCRAARKSARESGGTVAQSGDYGQRSTSGRSTMGSSSSRSFGSSMGERRMFKVICADCGKETEVPFEPRNGRPVYCRECFDRRSGRR
jgi:CxxC-x17-CxxC domain-containing protein